MSETNETAVAVRVPEADQLSVTRDPTAIVAEANKAATVLKDIIGKKTKQVRFNGKQYLEYEDWQTVGAFYGVTARVVSANYVNMDGVYGFEAKADAIDKSGRVLTTSESMCLSDERNWKGKPLFQLRSMAQTRACAGALRRVLSWVVVLAGYSGTPAEEMIDEHEERVEPRKAEASGPVGAMFGDRGSTPTLRKRIGRLVMDPANGFSRDGQEAARAFCDAHEDDDDAMRAELERLTQLSAGARETRAKLDADADVGFNQAAGK